MLTLPGNQSPQRHYQDREFEIGALASRHCISVGDARQIIEQCGSDLDCIDDEARKLTGKLLPA